jgi:putative membrane-bound dehydrogenase-like protein
MAAEIVAATASSHQDGHPPQLVLDGNAGTRSSQLGKGQWMQVQFSRAIAIDSVRIGFARGTRTYKFKLQFSVDGKNWTKPLAMASNGQGDGLQQFEFPKITCTFIRIVNQGNNDNDWTNIHTLSVDGVNVAAQALTPRHGDIVATEFATTGSVGSPVGISVDNHGRVYVTETRRRKRAAPDVRSLTPFMLDALESRSVDDKSAAIRKHRRDWENLKRYKEVIWRLVDEDGDGKYDKRNAFYEGLDEDVSGVAGGVLCVADDVYVTCIPSFYRLRDKDGDGQAEQIEELARGMGIHIGFAGHDMHGPKMGVDGRIYWSMGDKGVRVLRKEDGRDFFYPGHGAIFRIEQDGTGFELFASGLRSPQEFAFDEYGNLFAADNDADMGDRERLHFLVEGCDVGWRAFYQCRGRNYNPWMAEKLWQLKNELQPAYLSPPLDYAASGPIGMVYNPGTALNKKYRRHFFLANSSKSTAAFQMEPAGAGFRRINRHTILSNTFATGLSFGPDGALYAADWGNNGWQPHNRGRVLRLDTPETADTASRAATQQLLGTGVADRTVADLSQLLGHTDQRVRLLAQFELVKRTESKTLSATAESSANLLARLHAIWGLGQLGRGDKRAVEPLIDLLDDEHSEIRAQAAKVIGEAGNTDAADAVAKLLGDEPRVRLLASAALRSIGQPEHLAAAVRLLEENDGEDDFLRHGGIMALTGIGETAPERLADLRRHPSSTVRVAAAVALRRLGSSRVAFFLSDVDPRVAAEAARGIHDDLSIEPALADLARRLESPCGDNEPLARRAISANRRLADADSALRLAQFAADRKETERFRVDAINALAAWTRPQLLDGVQGFPRGLPAAEEAIAHAAMDHTVGALLSDPSRSIQSATAKAIASLKYGNATERMTQFAFDESQDIGIRCTSLDAMLALRAPRLDEALTTALKSPHDLLRSTALRVIGEHAPDSKETIAAAEMALTSQSLLERQTAFSVLGKSNSAEASESLLAQVKNLATLSPEVQLDAVHAAQASKHAGVKSLVGAFTSQVAKEPLGTYSLALQGGDAKEGQAIFKTNTAAACAQCHRLDGGDGNVGPDLAKIAAKRDRSYLLRAIVQPSADIEVKYRPRQFVLNNGKVVVGTIVSESNEHFVVAESAEKITRIAKQDIEEQLEQNVSIMPEVTKALSLRQIRDLVAFLSTLK